MPRITVPVTDVTLAFSTTPPGQTNADSVNENQLDQNRGKTFVEIVSSDAAPQTVSFVTPTSFGAAPAAIGDRVITIPAGATWYVGPFSPSLFNQPDGSLRIVPSVSTTLKFRAYSLGA